MSVSVMVVFTFIWGNDGSLIFPLSRCHFLSVLMLTTNFMNDSVALLESVLLIHFLRTDFIIVKNASLQ